ncbi:MAG: flavin reductase family protein [Oscillospiraceae bacterium]|jgi:flavin reductase (DIM6/NTAB) family NADH-FMN oxidoreductase RutF|nr:flavin reductase family protein [Oscillospiraceae bacterium]
MNRIDLESFDFNVFEDIGKRWMLLTAGTIDEHNTMTASWGQAGVVWGKNVLTCMIRPSRYTYGFVEDNDIFTASFFGDGNRGALNFCGANSGRDFENKSLAAGLTPISADADLGGVTFEQAKFYFVCKKIYRAEMLDENILDGSIRTNYGPGEGMHIFYVGEILAAYEK